MIKIDNALVLELMSHAKNYPHLEAHGIIFRDEELQALNIGPEHRAIPLSLRFMPLTLGMLGVNPVIVSFHSLQDSGEEVTISNRSFLYESQTLCTTIEYCCVGNHIWITIEYEAYPQTWMNINSSPLPIKLPCATATYVYEVDLVTGGLNLKSYNISRVEEILELGEVARYIAEVDEKRDGTITLTMEHLSNIRHQGLVQSTQFSLRRDISSFSLRGRLFGWSTFLQGFSQLELEEWMFEYIDQALVKKWDSPSMFMCL